MPVKTPEEATAFVKRWMDDRGVFRTDASDNSKDVYFSYEGTSDSGINFAIQQPINMARVVGVTTKILFDQRQLEDLVQEKRNNFLNSMSKKLLFVNPASALGPKLEKPEWILFIKEISYDELTEGRLIDAVDQVSRAVIFASSLIIDELGEPKAE